MADKLYGTNLPSSDIMLQAFYWDAMWKERTREMVYLSRIQSGRAKKSQNRIDLDATAIQVPGVDLYGLYSNGLL